MLGKARAEKDGQGPATGIMKYCGHLAVFADSKKPDYTVSYRHDIAPSSPQCTNVLNKFYLSLSLQ